MSDIEQLTIVVPFDLAAAVRDAVKGGDYASSSDVVREALLDWTAKRSEPGQALSAMRADIRIGLDDIEQGRTYPFDIEDIAQLGRAQSTGH